MQAPVTQIHRAAHRLVIREVYRHSPISRADVARRTGLTRTTVSEVVDQLLAPWDIGAYPAAGTHACTYSILEPSLDGLADGLFGRLPFPGVVPVGTRTPA